MENNNIWISKINELKPVQFEYLEQSQKINYINKIESLPVDHRSTFEKVILKKYYRDLELSNQKQTI